MFTKNMLKRALHGTRKNCHCYVVVDGVAREIKAAVASQTFYGMAESEPKVWLVVGPVAAHTPPAEIHQPLYWLNRKHNRKVDA